MVQTTPIAGQVSALVVVQKVLLADRWLVSCKKLVTILFVSACCVILFEEK